MINLKTTNWEIKDIDTVLFDKDGTFVDLHFFWGKITELRVEEVIKYYNLDNSFFEKLCLYLGYDNNSKTMLASGITALYSRSKIIEIFNENLNNLGINSNEDEIIKIFDKVSDDFNKAIKDYIKLIPEAIEFIKKIKKTGLKTGIITSDSIISTNLTLDLFGLNKYFDVVVARETTNFTKESGEPTKFALNYLNSNPETSLMIGDAPTDCFSAQNAGVKNVILVATGQEKLDELYKCNRFVLNSLNEVEIITN